MQTAAFVWDSVGKWNPACQLFGGDKENLLVQPPVPSTWPFWERSVLPPPQERQIWQSKYLGRLWGVMWDRAPTAVVQDSFLWMALIPKETVMGSLPEITAIWDASVVWGPCQIILITLVQPPLCSWEIPCYLNELEEGKMLCCCCACCACIVSRVLGLW